MRLTMAIDQVAEKAAESFLEEHGEEACRDFVAAMQELVSSTVKISPEIQHDDHHINY